MEKATESLNQNNHKPEQSETINNKWKAKEGSEKNQAKRPMDRLQLIGELCLCWQSTILAICQVT